MSEDTILTEFHREKKGALIPYHTFRYMATDSLRFIRRDLIHEIHIYKITPDRLAEDPEFYKDKLFCIMHMADGKKEYFNVKDHVGKSKSFQDPRNVINVYTREMPNDNG